MRKEMKLSNTQEALLLAYVDCRATGPQRAEAELLIENNSEAMKFVSLMKQTDLPYREAFDTDLGGGNHFDEAREFVEQWQAPEDSGETRTPARSYAWVATLVLGVFLGYGATQWSAFTSTGNQVPAWLAQVASYHELYVRETVEGGELSHSERDALTLKLASALDAPLHIPDLLPQKMQFKRGQLLQIEGRALIQLAYLPDEGTPVALCITKNGEADAGFSSGESHGLRYVNWSRDGVSYVLLGALPGDRLMTAAENAAAQML